MNHLLRSIPGPYRTIALLEGLRVNRAGANATCQELIQQTGRALHQQLIDMAQERTNDWRHRVRALNALARTGRPLRQVHWDAVGLLTDDDHREIRAAANEVLCFLGCEKTVSKFAEQ